MEKIADNYYRVKQMVCPSQDVKLDMTVELIDGEYLDTHVDLTGSFWVGGNKRAEFAKKLGNLIDGYRI